MVWSLEQSQKIGDAEKQVIVSLYKDGKSYAQIAEILKYTNHQ